MMMIRDNGSDIDQDGHRYARALDIYGRVLSVVLLTLGLRQWAVIVGVASSPGGAFETMSVAWQLATMYLAVVDLVAAVGLWMRVSWGDVLWLCAALSEIALHTIFQNSFGSDYTILGFHLIAIAGYVTLNLLARKEQEIWPFQRR